MVTDGDKQCKKNQLCVAVPDSDDILLSEPEKHLDCESLTPDHCYSWFELEKDGIPGLAMALALLQELVGATKIHCTGLESLCILLLQLASKTWKASLHGQSVSKLSVSSQI